jgi:hypothetical protein
MRPRQCTNDDVYGHYTLTGFYWKLYPCSFTPMMRALEAFMWISFISLLATIALAVKDIQKRRKAEIVDIKREIPAALPMGRNTDRKPKVEDVIEVVEV